MTPRPHTGGPNMAFRASEKSAPKSTAPRLTLGDFLAGLVYMPESPHRSMLGICEWASSTLMDSQLWDDPAGGLPAP